jgi:hypothetical protein
MKIFCSTLFIIIALSFFYSCEKKSKSIDDLSPIMTSEFQGNIASLEDGKVYFADIEETESKMKDEYFTTYEEKFIGIYLPIKFIESIENSKNFRQSMLLNRDRLNDKSNQFYYDILILKENRIYSDLGFHDGYAIYAEKTKYFQFIDNNEDILINDHNGHLYKKISEEIDNYDEIVENFIGKIIFLDLIENNKVSISNGIINVLQQNIIFQISLGWYIDDANLELRDLNRNLLALKIENGKFMIYKTRHLGGFDTEITNDIELEI